MIFLGELAALGAALLWSVNAVVLTTATNRVGSFAVNIGRLFFSSIFLILTIPLLSGSFDLSLMQYILLIISGIIGLIIGDTAMLKSYEEIGPRLGMLMMASVPPMSAILAFFFLGEILSVIAITGIALTVIGIGIVIIQKKSQGEKYHFTMKGIIYGLVSSAGQAVGLIIAKEAFIIGDLNELVAAFIRIFFSLVLLILLGRLTGRAKNPVRVFREDKIALKNTIWGAILGPYLGITASLIAINYAKVGIASTLMATVPVLMLPISKFYYKEQLTPASIFGALIAVIGVTIIFLF